MFSGSARSSSISPSPEAERCLHHGGEDRLSACLREPREMRSNRWMAVRLRGLVVGTVFGALGPRATSLRAAVPLVGPRVAADTLTAMPAANITKPLRVVARLQWGQATPQWSRFSARGRWQAAWDAATGVPRRIWGSGISFPGATLDPQIAERAAHQVLVDNIGLLAPGASAGDF